MQFRDDMYSLLFIANLKPKYKKDCEDKAQEEQDRMDAMMKRNKSYFKE